MLFTKVAPLVALTPLTLASTYDCTQDFALDWPYGSSSTSEDACADYCGQDADCLQACYETAETGQCNSVGCPDPTDLIRRAHVKKGVDATKRASFQCDDNESCYLYTDGDLLCYDDATGEYDDSAGGHGNGQTGVYTYADGTVTTIGADPATTSESVPTATEDSTTPTPTSDNVGESTETDGVGRVHIGTWALGISGLTAMFIGAF
ncbi:hypothetical protein F5Y18DRAFT_440151 [Xylariaceae sp. FL1019]|nr:hypothetical protein F5Y18DRAFT_440151 [Xylariaceae sp. FL1019]